MTTTVTTTTTTAPITVVAAPITTTVNTTNTTNTSSSATTQGPAPPARVEAKGERARLEIDLHGCGRKGRVRAPSQTQLRLTQGAQLVLRVNGRRVGVLDLNPGDGATAKPVPFRIRLRPDGTLSVSRPSGRVLTTQGCSAHSREEPLRWPSSR